MNTTTQLAMAEHQLPVTFLSPTPACRGHQMANGEILHLKTSERPQFLCVKSGRVEIRFDGLYGGVLNGSNRPRPYLLPINSAVQLTALEELYCCRCDGCEAHGPTGTRPCVVAAT